MSAQTTLTENAPVILDATCSYGRIWPKHATIRIDIRPEVHPDIVMNAIDLKFQDTYFDVIYCDPPHLFSPGKQTIAVLHRRMGGRMSPTMFQRYGWWNTRKDWLAFIKGTNREFYRCLKRTGTLEYKILDGKGNGTTHLSELLEGMTNFTVVADRMTKSRTNFNSNSKCHWLTLKPKPCQKQ